MSPVVSQALQCWEDVRGQRLSAEQEAPRQTQRGERAEAEKETTYQGIGFSRGGGRLSKLSLAKAMPSSSLAV